MAPLIDRVPGLRVVMEHVTTAEAAAFVAGAPEGRVAATVTPQHLLWNRNEIFRGGIRPHAFCLPVLKRERHRQALVEAVTSGSPRFFLGTDSAPHAKGAKESACGCAGIFSAPVALQVYAQVFANAGALDKLEGFASLHGPRFYGEPPNEDTVTLVEEPFTVPDEFAFGSSVVVPICAGEQLQWSLK
jgi:dihydroorotase